MHLLETLKYLFPFSIFTLSPFYWYKFFVCINPTDAGSMHPTCTQKYEIQVHTHEANFNKTCEGGCDVCVWRCLKEATWGKN